MTDLPQSVNSYNSLKVFPVPKSLKMIKPNHEIQADQTNDYETNPQTASRQLSKRSYKIEHKQYKTKSIMVPDPLTINVLETAGKDGLNIWESLKSL